MSLDIVATYGWLQMKALEERKRKLYWAFLPLTKVLCPKKTIAKFGVFDTWALNNSKMNGNIAPSECWSCCEEGEVVATCIPTLVDDIEGDFMEVQTPKKCLSGSHYFVEVDDKIKGDILIPVQLKAMKSAFPSMQCEGEQNVLHFIDLDYALPVHEPNNISRFLAFPTLTESNTRRKFASEFIIDYSQFS